MMHITFMPPLACVSKSNFFWDISEKVALGRLPGPFLSAPENRRHSVVNHGRAVRKTQWLVTNVTHVLWSTLYRSISCVELQQHLYICMENIIFFSKNTCWNLHKWAGLCHVGRWATLFISDQLSWVWRCGWWGNQGRALCNSRNLCSC
jgi:hypothetical protein